MRSKYDTYPEYHTSLDNLDLVSPAGLQGAFDVLRRCLECLEMNETLKTTVLCEPQLGRRGLYPTISTRESGKLVSRMMHVLATANGAHDLLAIADRIDVPLWELTEIVAKLKQHGVLAAAGESPA